MFFLTFLQCDAAMVSVELYNKGTFSLKMYCDGKRIIWFFSSIGLVAFCHHIRPNIIFVGQLEKDIERRASGVQYLSPADQ